MHDSESKRVLDRNLKKADLQELKGQKDIDAVPGKVTEKEVEEFYAVASSMKAVLGQLPSADFSPEISSSQRYALQALYMARTATDIETGEFISGLAQSEHLNQALMYLQPILALGLRPDFKAGRVVYDQLVAQVTEVRAQIRSAILMQIVPRKKRKKPKKKGDEAGGGPDTPAGADDVAGADAAAAGGTTESDEATSDEATSDAATSRAPGARERRDAYESGGED